MSRTLTLLVMLPVLSACTFIFGSPVPAPPPPPNEYAAVGGEYEGKSIEALLISHSDNEDGEARQASDAGERGRVGFEPLRRARSAVTAAEDDKAVQKLAAEQLAQAKRALEQAEARWAEIANAPQGKTVALADIADSSHAARRWAEIAQARVRRDIALAQVESAKREAEQRRAERQRWVGETVVPGEFGDIRFDVGTASLTGDWQSVMDRLAAFLKEHPRLRFKIAGHTDDAPPSSANLRRFLDANPDVASEHESEAGRAAAYNLAMSRRRAQAVAQALTERGIDDERLEVAGYGQKRPIASNDTAEGRRRNRRVEVLVLGPT